MNIIDTHAHIYPPKIERIATTAIQNFYSRPYMRHNGSPEELIASGSKAGVTHYLVFSTATTTKQVQPINDFIMSQVQQHSNFIGAGTLFIDFADYENELKRIYAGGLRGVKFHPDFQKFNIDAPELFPMFEVLQCMGMYIIVHSGDPRYEYSRPERVANVAKNFPNMKIIAAHFGGWNLWEVGRKNLVLPNVYVDTSSTFGFGGVEPFVKGLQTFDPTHIFFGCDFPMWDHGEELRRIEQLHLKEDFLEDILFNNFSAFYGGIK